MWSKKIKYLLTKRKKRPNIIVLVDPDKFNKKTIQLADKLFVDFFFVGGSSTENLHIHQTIKKIKSISKKPVIIFPGNEKQISPLADGILFLSLVSGRNPEYLIEKQMKAAPAILKYQIPFLPTAYLLIDGKNKSTTEKITGTKSLPQKKDSIYKTCLASAMLGMQAIYLEAGSGAIATINSNIINFIKQNINLPIIAGGGINSIQHIESYLNTNLDSMVIGNALEKNPLFLNDIKNYFKWK